VAEMRRTLMVLSLLCGIALARPADAIQGMCAAAAFFNYQSELLNHLCFVELSLNSGDIPELGDPGYEGRF
jgi:hypothetical protein